MRQWQILVQLSTSCGFRFPLNSASLWITTGKERPDLRRALGLLACLQHSRLLSLIVVICVGEKKSPEVSFQHASCPEGLRRGVNFNTAAWQWMKRSGERVACVCMCEVDGLRSRKAPLFTQHKHLSKLTNASLRSPRTPQHQTLKQQQRDWCEGSTCCCVAGIDGVPGDRCD